MSVHKHKFHIPEDSVTYDVLKHNSDHSDKNIIHEEHPDERWLVSYADMMTLLFGLFVVLYAFTPQMKEVQKSIDEAFNSKEKKDDKAIEAKKEEKSEQKQEFDSNKKLSDVKKIIAEDPAASIYFRLPCRACYFVQAFRSEEFQGRLGHWNGYKQVVMSIPKGRPAEKAGLRVEDVILESKDEKVDSMATSFEKLNLIRTLKILRQGQEMQIALKLDDLSDEEIAVMKKDYDEKIRTYKDVGFGITARDLSLVDRVTLQIGNWDQGVLIENIDLNRWVTYANVTHHSDLVQSVNGIPIETVEQLEIALKNANGPITLSVFQPYIGEFGASMLITYRGK